MKGSNAVYLGRLVSKENFRAFIYAPNGGQRLVESWAEFEANMESGVWFATKEDALASIASPAIVDKPKTKTRTSKAKMAVEPVDEAFEDDNESVHEDAAFEVTADDGFLPKASK